jgi:hypothetical protein
MKNLEKNIPANKNWEIRKKEILNQLNNRQETLEIKTENFRYFEKQNGRFKFESSDLFVEQSELGPDDGDIHFLPTDAKYFRGVMNVTEEVQVKDRRRFKKLAIIKLIEGLENLVKFIEERPDTKIGNITLFHGVTNREMANFMKNKLGLDYHDIPNEDGEFTFLFHIEELKNGLTNFKERYSQTLEQLKRELS